MIAAVYARKSTDQSTVADESRSTTRQIDHARAYAKSKGWTVEDRFIFCDDAVSGAEFENRPAFVRLMATATPQTKPTPGQPRRPAPGPPFTILIVSDLDRLGRESIETVFSIKTLAQRGIRTFAYLTDTEIKLDTPQSALVTQLAAFAAATEREKASSRTRDGLLRRARAGYAVGGSVFGYDNHEVRGPDGRRSHVERQINVQQAAIVRKIFSLYAEGHGQITIAKTLNREHALSPRGHGWGPSSIREVLHRELYAGVLWWSRTRKRDAWGRLADREARPRPASDWIKVEQPALRVVSAAQWASTQQRMATTRACYLRSTHGAVNGRPVDATARAYLLTGMARCGVCGASLEVRTSGGRGGSSGVNSGPRIASYLCTNWYRKGPTACGNALHVRIDVADAAVLGAVEALLGPTFAARVRSALATRPMPAADAEPSQIEDAIREQQQHLDNLVAQLAMTHDSPTVAGAIAAGEVRLRELQHQHQQQRLPPPLSDATINRLRATAMARAKDWRGSLRRNRPIARQILGKLLLDRLVFTPERKGKQQGYRFEAKASLAALLVGSVAAGGEASNALTSMNRAGKTAVRAARAMVTEPSSSGCRSTSST